MKRLVGIGLCFILLAAGSSDAETVSAEWVERWAEDLQSLRTQIREVHPNAHHHASAEELDGAIDRLIQRLPELEHHEVVVGLAEVIALLRDGHSRLTLPLPEDSDFFLGHSPTPLPEIPGLVFRPLPIRLQLFSDGLHVLRVDRQHARVAGWRVTAIGGRPIDQVLDRVGRVVHHDNAMQLALQLPDYLVMPEVLHATGIVDAPDTVPVTVESPGGERAELQLAPVPAGRTTEWVDARPAGVPTPRYLTRNDENFWFEYLAESRTVYWQYNEVYPTDTETTAQFADRLFDFVDGHEVERLIVDLRWNRGGDNANNLPLLHGLIACDKLKRPGSVYVIAGRGTFSAAMMFAVDLEQHTPALFVGELTGSTPNHYGDSRKTRLKHSGLTIRLSTLDWQNSDPRDDRPGIAPHLPATLASGDYRAGRDPAMEAILRNRGVRPELAGHWRGLVNLGNADYDFGADLRKEGDRWVGSLKVVDVIDASTSEFALESIRVGTGEVTAQVDLGNRVVDLTFRPLDGRLVGDIRFGVRRYPFALARD